MKSKVIQTKTELQMLLKHLPKPVKEYVQTITTQKEKLRRQNIRFIRKIQELNKELKWFKQQEEPIKAILPLNEYPLGTKAFTNTGEYWIKQRNGWKFTNGHIYSKPTSEFNGKIKIPV